MCWRFEQHSAFWATAALHKDLTPAGVLFCAADLDDLHSHEACDLEPDKEYSLPLLIIDGEHASALHEAACFLQPHSAGPISCCAVEAPLR